MKRLLLIALLSFVFGIVIGYYLHPSPDVIEQIFLDAANDPRACTIKWEDGESLYKSREIDKVYR